MKRLHLFSAFFLGCTAVIANTVLVDAKTPVTPTVVVLVRPNVDGLCDNTHPINCESNLGSREAQVGKLLGLSDYQSWDWSSLPALDWAVSGGRAAMLTWQHGYGTNHSSCIFWQDVVNGNYDTQLAAQASYIAAYPINIIVRLLPEMEADHQRCLYDSDDAVVQGAEYVAIWQHVYGVVKPIAPNALFDFSPGPDAWTQGGVPQTLWQDYYPGDAYVDYIGSEIYNMTSSPVPITTFGKFNNWYSQAVTRGKPLILSETGAPNDTANSPTAQQKWWSSIYANLSASYPAITAVVAFDVTSANVDYHLDGAGLTAFTTMRNKAYFSKPTP